MLLIKNGHIKTMAGTEYKNGCILVDEKGKIAQIAENIEAPDGVDIIDAGGRLVTPGCVEGHSHIGMCDGYTDATNDTNEKTDPITPHLRAIDSINPVGEMFENAIKAGVTTACTGPGSANILCGTFAAIKLYGTSVNKMIIKEAIGMKAAFGENPKKVYGINKGRAPLTRMGCVAVLREFLFKAKKYAEEDANGEKHAFDLKLESMIPVMRREMPLKFHVHQANDILSVIRVAKEFDLKVTLDHCTDGVLVIDEIKESGFSALLGPFMGKKSKFELMSKSYDNPAKFCAAGVPFCIVTDSPVNPQEYLPLHAGLCVKAGLDIEEAWKAITIYPAKITGIDDRVGSLEVGKDADIVIWTADPLVYVSGTSYKTIIDGKVVYSKE